MNEILLFYVLLFVGSDNLLPSIGYVQHFEIGSPESVVVIWLSAKSWVTFCLINNKIVENNLLFLWPRPDKG